MSPDTISAFVEGLTEVPARLEYVSVHEEGWMKEQKEKVANAQVGHQHMGDCVQLLIAPNDVTEDHIAEHSHQRDRPVHRRGEDFKPKSARNGHIVLQTFVKIVGARYKAEARLVVEGVSETAGIAVASEQIDADETSQIEPTVASHGASA